MGALIVVFTLLAGILAGIQTFLDYKSMGEAHKVAASGWEDLRWQIERIIVSTPDGQDIDSGQLNVVEETASKLRKQSPTIHNDHWDEAEKAFEPSKID